MGCRRVLGKDSFIIGTGDIVVTEEVVIGF